MWVPWANDRRRRSGEVCSEITKAARCFRGGLYEQQNDGRLFRRATTRLLTVRTGSWRSFISSICEAQRCTALSSVPGLPLLPRTMSHHSTDRDEGQSFLAERWQP